MNTESRTAYITYLTEKFNAEQFRRMQALLATVYATGQAPTDTRGVYRIPLAVLTGVQYSDGHLAPWVDYPTESIRVDHEAFMAFRVWEHPFFQLAYQLHEAGWYAGRFGKETAMTHPTVIFLRDDDSKFMKIRPDHTVKGYKVATA